VKVETFTLRVSMMPFQVSSAVVNMTRPGPPVTSDGPYVVCSVLIVISAAQAQPS